MRAKPTIEKQLEVLQNWQEKEFTINGQLGGNIVNFGCRGKLKDLLSERQYMQTELAINAWITGLEERKDKGDIY